MKTRKFLLLPVGVIAIVALLAATNAFAQSTFDNCNSYAIDRKGTVIPGNFTVTVDQTAVDGRRIYTYTMTSANNTNPNKFSVWVRRGLYSEEGFSAGCTGGCEANYLEPVYPYDQNAGGFPPAQAWTFAVHEDQVAYTSVAIATEPTLNVKERFEPLTSLTTVLIGVSNGYEFCGPIYGPKNPSAEEVEGSPVFGNIVARVEMNNGCIYNMTADAVSNIVIDVEKHPDSPEYEIYGCGGENEPNCESCGVTVQPGICEDDTNLEHCPRLELGRDPLQHLNGGTCYAPPNIKFRC